MPRRFALFRAILWPVLIAVLVITASARSHVAAPSISNIDKVSHFAVYGLFATLVCRIGRGWRGALLGLFVASAFGATDEWHQSFVPGRSTEFADWLADTLGATLAVSLYWGWTQYRRVLEWPLTFRRQPAEGALPASPAVVNEDIG